MGDNDQRLLFLCTGNYYRSRFAEEYFNQRCDELGLSWNADSRGLAERMDAFPENFGPMSVHALRYLEVYGVTPRALRRYPLSARADDFERFARIIALSRREHAPMLEARFPSFMARVEFFDVEDVEVERPEIALPRLVHRLDRLIDSLVTAAGNGLDSRQS